MNAHGAALHVDVMKEYYNIIEKNVMTLYKTNKYESYMVVLEENKL